jgi:hypothetical protein
VALDLEIAQAIFQARQIERAVNDNGPWTITYGGHVAPACRWVTEREVIFVAHFPDVCWLDVEEPALLLHCRDELVGTRPIDPPVDGEWKAQWTFALSTPVRA